MSGDAGNSGDPEPFVEPNGCIELPSSGATVFLAAFDDDFASSCERSEGGRDAAFTFTAPAAGRYVFEGRGDHVDEPPLEPLQSGPSSSGEWTAPILSILDGPCGGEELDCFDRNLTLEAGYLTRAVVTLGEGDTVTVVVEQNVGDADDAAHDLSGLSVERVACGEIDLGSEVPASSHEQVYGTTPPIGPATCALQLGEAPAEKSWLFRAPATGRYAVTFTAEYAHAFALAAMTEDCLAQIGCASSIQEDIPARLELELQADQVIALVGSAPSSGDTDYTFDLNIELQPEP